MSSSHRRGGAEIAKFLGASDPSVDSSAAQLYAKTEAGAVRLFSMDSAGTVNRVRRQFSIWDKPLVAHAYDDEFELATLDASWTPNVTLVTGIDPYAAFGAANTRCEIHTRRKSWMMIQPPATGGGSQITKTTTLQTNQFVWMRGSSNYRLNTAPTNNDMSLVLQLYADASNYVQLFITESDASVLQVEYIRLLAGVSTSIAVTVDKYVSQSEIQEIQAVGFQKIGTTYHGWAFSETMALHLGSTTFTPTVTATNLIVTNAVSTAPGNAIMGIDFIRFVNSATFLP